MVEIKAQESRTETVDMVAFEKFFKSHYSGLCGYAFKLIRDVATAEEVVQDTFVKIWEKRAALNITSSFESYIFRALHNNCMNVIRENARRKDMEKEVKLMTEYFDEPEDDNQLRQSLLEQRIIAAIHGLPEQCRQVFELSKIERLKYKEIAEKMNISVKTVENHMGRALKKLRDDLADEVFIMMIFLFAKQ
ncbi:MAG: RNA polymerase sigma-70 factor [Bacteroidota bacterium]